jgi:hypothetical protein
MKIPTCGALRCAFLECRRLYGTLRQVHCFLEISLIHFAIARFWPIPTQTAGF